MRKEVILVVSAQTALKCLALPDISGPKYSPQYVECIELVQRAAPRAIVEKVMRIEAIVRLMQRAGGMVCICDDSEFPGYGIAVYDARHDCWLRFQSKPLAVSQCVADGKGHRLAK